jgi:hypothetical protein
VRRDATPHLPEGTRRVARRFLWLPLVLESSLSTAETRWLERAEILQVYYWGPRGLSEWGGWLDERWAS